MAPAPFWTHKLTLPPAGYSRDVGPGVYDIHSPVVPTVEWIAAKLRSFVEVGARVCGCALCADAALLAAGGGSELRLVQGGDT